MNYRFGRKLSLRSVLIVGTAVVSLSGAPARADMYDWFNVVSGVESGHRYNVMNQTGSSALGRYQIIFDNWKGMGFVTGSNWNNAVFTPETQRLYGVSTKQQLLETEAGHRLQDIVAQTLMRQKWNSLGAATKRYILSESNPNPPLVNGIQMNEAMMMRLAWFLGPKQLERWAERGFTLEGLAAVNAMSGDKIRAQNGGDLVKIFNRELGHALKFKDVDISDITQGSHMVGGGELYKAMGITGSGPNGEVLFADCDPEVLKDLQGRAINYVTSVTALAQDKSVGYAQMEKPLGVMSCIDFAFSGGIDVLFKVPDINGIMSSMKDFACQSVNSMVTEATSQVGNVLRSLSGNYDGGMLGGFGVQYNPNGRGIQLVSDPSKVPVQNGQPPVQTVGTKQSSGAGSNIYAPRQGRSHMGTRVTDGLANLMR